MKIFLLIKKEMTVLGFIPNQQQKNHQWKFPFNGRQKIIIICYIIEMIFLGVFILHEAKDIEEYTNSIFELTAASASSIIFISIVYKSDKVFNAIENCEHELIISK